MVKRSARSLEYNIRGYIDTVIYFMRCSMDVQASDGKGMLLSYVSSYVTKWHDGVNNDALYEVATTTPIITQRYLTDHLPGEPQMALMLNKTDLAFSSFSTKRLTLPKFKDMENTNKTMEAYCNRNHDEESQTILDFLRSHTKGADNIYRPYKKYINVNAAVQTATPLSSEYFWQYTVMNSPFRSLQQLLPGNIKTYPKCLRPIATALHHNEEFWTEKEALVDHFQTTGNTALRIKNLMQGMNLNNDASNSNQYSLSPAQFDAYNEIVASLPTECSHMDSDDEVDEDDSVSNDVSPVSHNLYSICGEAGTSKSLVLIKLIETTIERGIPTLIACPTGLLASQYADHFGGAIQSRTVHAIFRYPVKDAEQRSTINWDLAEYSLIFLDEVNQVPSKIMDHVIRTIEELPNDCTFIVCGDKYQIPPIDTGDAVLNLYSMAAMRKFRNFHLREHFRVNDPRLKQFLDIIRYSIPTLRQISYFLEDNVVDEELYIADNVIQVFKKHPNTTFLAVSNVQVNFINAIITKEIFGGSTPLLEDATLDSLDKIEEESYSIYKGQRVIVTQNVSPEMRVVNGKEGVVHCREGDTLILKTFIAVFPVFNNVGKRYYPLKIGFARTIYKCQGQNLPHVTIWFDCYCGAATAYVACSRVKRLQDLLFLALPKTSDFRPLSY